MNPFDLLGRRVRAMRVRVRMRASHVVRFDMVGMVATLAILDFRSLGVASVITTRFVVLVAIAVLVVLAWGIAMVLAIILMMLLIKPITVKVFVGSLSTVDTVGESVPALATRFLGLVVFLGLLLPSEILATTPLHTSASWQPSKNS